ncbi:hypothetical protein CS311_01445 [Lactiplantibacillus plantarum]|nr:hypothetical protein [Lactiplantibacillus plantarum]PHY26493.1 hypothetical protein CS306_01540 [Lactiplantibacillus plantarum]PHY46148.1 hypothetical protein CS311_01445 [Lactiplantibacillus plantarum]PHY60131.1 hypothetical protein CS303_00950 [Lactiplantibacillus plantarum]
MAKIKRQTPGFWGKLSLLIAIGQLGLTVFREVRQFKHAAKKGMTACIGYG